jgi:hypothetical protein
VGETWFWPWIRARVQTLNPVNDTNNRPSVVWTLSARNVYEIDNLCSRCSVRVITARTDTCWYNWGSWAFSSVIPAERCRSRMLSSFPVKLQGGGIDTNGWLDQYCRLLVVPAERCWSYWALSFRFFNSIPKIHIRDFVQWIYEQSNNKYVSSM